MLLLREKRAHEVKKDLNVFSKFGLNLLLVRGGSSVYQRVYLHLGNVMFVHVSIRTSNMERAIDFYTRLLGLQLLSRGEIPQNNAEIAFLKDPQGKGCTLELTFYRCQKAVLIKSGGYRR